MYVSMYVCILLLLMSPALFVSLLLRSVVQPRSSMHACMHPISFPIPIYPAHHNDPGFCSVLLTSRSRPSSPAMPPLDCNAIQACRRLSSLGAALHAPYYSLARYANRTSPLLFIYLFIYLSFYIRLGAAHGTARAGLHAAFCC